MYIYKTTNLINGKVYIGKSEKEFTTEYLGSDVLLSKAIEKYGKENFKVELIEECDTNDTLNDREKFWIKEYMGDNCYNIAEGGSGGNTLGNHPNKKAHYKSISKKISETLKGHTVSIERRKKQSKSHTGWFKRLSEDEQNAYREKLSKKLKDVYKDGHHSKGKSLTDEHKEKLSKKAKENGFGGDTWSNLTEDERNIRCMKLSKSLTGRVVSEETKMKISNSLKNRKK